MSKICAIHQPDFFPWLGVFDKIQQSDLFVILDDVQIIKTGSSYSNRVALNINGVAKDFTAPIKRVSGVQNINEVQFVDNNWREKFKKTLQTNYSKSKNFKQYQEIIFELIDYKTDSLCEYNLNALTHLCQILNISFENKIILSSSLSIQTQSQQRIIDICKILGCNEYLSGNGARAYQNEEDFSQEGIQLTYQQFEHPIYTQSKSKEFIKGLSVIDYIFEGISNV